MHNAKPTRPNSRYNADNKAITIDPKHYPFLRFPKESPVQPSDRVEWMDEDGKLLTGMVLEDGAYLMDNVLYVRVDFDECIDAVVAASLTKVFDYEVLDTETRIVVQQKTGEILSLTRRVAESAIDIGNHLIVVKNKLGHGSFGKWLSAEFGWTDRTAQNFMNIAIRFKSEIISDLKLGPTVLGLLAAPSTPDEARQDIIQQAQAGNPITVSTVKGLIAQHKGERPISPAPQPPASAISAQAAVAFPPVTRPPGISYGKREDDFVDDVPSVDANEPDWLDDALNGKEAETVNLDIGDVVNTKNGRTGGEVLKLDAQLGVLVKFPGSTPWWLQANALILVRRKSETIPVSQARADLEQITDSPARERLTAIVAQHEADAADRAKRMANWQEHERLRNLAAQTPPPVGQYRTIVVDPPWPMKKIERGVRPNQSEYLDYPTMQLADIYNLGIAKLAPDDGCHLYLWTTHKFLPEALKIVARWGFRYNCLMTWVKTSGMTPYHYRFNTEHVVFATRGSMAVQRKGLPLAFEGESLGHSRKPDAFYDMVTLASPGPRIDVFARCEREGFVGWGNEVNHAAAAS